MFKLKLIFFSLKGLEIFGSFRTQNLPRMRKLRGKISSFLASAKPRVHLLVVSREKSVWIPWAPPTNSCWLLGSGFGESNIREGNLKTFSRSPRFPHYSSLPPTVSSSLSSPKPTHSRNSTILFLLNRPITVLTFVSNLISRLLQLNYLQVINCM